MIVSPARQTERKRQARIIEPFLNSLIAGLESRGFNFYKRPEDVYGDRSFDYDLAYLEMKIVGSFPTQQDANCYFHVRLKIRDQTRSMTHRSVLCLIADQMRKKLEVCRIIAWGADKVAKHNPADLVDSIVLLYSEWDIIETAARQFANQTEHVIMEFATEQIKARFGAEDTH